MSATLENLDSAISQCLELSGLEPEHLEPSKNSRKHSGSHYDKSDNNLLVLTGGLERNASSYSGPQQENRPQGYDQCNENGYVVSFLWLCGK